MAAVTTNERPVSLEELVRAYQAGVWRYLRFLGCDESQADDLTQETFLAVHRRPFVQHSPPETFAYLRTVARNQLLMSIRRSKRRPVIEDIELAESVWRQFNDSDGGDAYLEALRECVETLAGRSRQAIDLRYRDDRSRAEIAQALEMTEDGVKTLLRRTRDVLRRCVEQRLDRDEG